MIRRCLARRIVLAALVHREELGGHKVSPGMRKRLEVQAREYVVSEIAARRRAA
jgi:hypothetical protein